MCIVQFETSKECVFFSCWDEFQMMFCDLGNTCTLTVAGADGGLPASPVAVKNRMMADNKPRISDNIDKIRRCKFPDIVDSTQLKVLRLPDPLPASKVVHLLYTYSGVALLALASDAIHKLWKWSRTEHNPSGKSSASTMPQLWQPATGNLMTNTLSDTKPAEESVACIALSKNDCYIMSASGEKISLYNMIAFKVMKNFMGPPPATTYLAFHPQDNNIIAIGMEDSTILIFNVQTDEIKSMLKGHQKRITGLAFSQTLNVLVSSGADAQLCVWNIEGWVKMNSRPIQARRGYPSPLVGETKIQFCNDQTHLLVVHESHISVYNIQLECLQSVKTEMTFLQWHPRGFLSASISSATYSCDGLLIFAGFRDGAIGVFDAGNFRLRCRLAPSAYTSSPIARRSSGCAFPVVVAAHPSQPNQIALGMSDGAVYVIEPFDAEQNWGRIVPQ
ncbi:unnamed protein product [Camellia sinensis]